jgi:hypothetical protein
MMTFGKTSTDEVIPLLLDASGNVIVSASQLTTTGGKVKVDSSGRVIVTSDNPSTLVPTGKAVNVGINPLAVGVSVNTFLTISAGEIWEMQSTAFQFGGGVAGVTMSMDFVIGGVSSIYYYSGAIVAGNVYTVSISAILQAGDVARITFAGVGGGSYASVWALAKRIQ